MINKTLYDKLWDNHLIKSREDGSSLIYIDRHILHEVTSPQAFEGLKLAGRKPWRIDTNVATTDHNISTDISERKGGINGIPDETSRIQVKTLNDNCNFYGIKEFEMNDPGQGIVHVMGPELGATLPGMTVVCGDSHTSTHGALGCLAMGIGTSEVEHVLATQCLKVSKLKNMLVKFEGTPSENVSSKDIVLYFNTNANLIIFDKLLNYITIENIKRKSVESPYTDKVIVLTGTLNNMSRDEAKQTLQNLGAKVNSTVSKNTDFLIIGDQPGSKAIKAKELNIPIVNEEELIGIIQKFNN